MSKKDKKLEDGWSTAIKAFGAVAAVALVGQKIVSTVRDGSMMPSEYASQYGLVKNLATSPDSKSLTNGKNKNSTKSYTQYSLSELERFKELYMEEMEMSFQKCDYQRHRWLLDILQLLDATIALANNIQRGDFSCVEALQEHYQQLDERLQGEERSIGLVERIKATVGLGASRSRARDRGEMPPRHTSSRRKRHYEESAEPSSNEEDGKRTLRPRSAKARRTPPTLPIVGQVISPSPASSEDTEDQSVITTASSRSSPPKPAKSRCSSASNSSNKQGSRARSAKRGIFPHDMVGLSVYFPEDGGEGEITEALCEDIGYSDADLKKFVRFKIRFENEIVEKPWRETFDNTEWPVNFIDGHRIRGNPEDSSYEVKVFWKKLPRFAFNPTWEPLESADREACIKYAKKKNLLNSEGWTFLNDTEDAEDAEDAEDSKEESEEEEASEDGDNQSVSASSNRSDYIEEEEEAEDNEGEPEDDEWENSLVAAVSQDSTFASAGGFNLLGDRFDNDDDSSDPEDYDC